MSKVILLEGANDANKADFRLMRLCEWAGYSLEQFERHTAAGESLSGLSDTPSVVLSMGYQAGDLFGVNNLLDERGYIRPGPSGSYVVPTVHPTFIQRGQSRYSAAFIADLQKAVRLAQQGMPAQVLDYELDPSPMAAYGWAKRYLLALSMEPHTRLAFDIETPGKGNDEEELEVGDSGHDRTWTIERIGFSYKGLGALSIPWAPEHMATIRALMGSQGQKVVWNAGFDVPRIKHQGVAIGGVVHDAMVAWHILHSDLPKSLNFVATFTCPFQPRWKHLSGARPAFYNATDADVELRSMEVIEKGLREAGMWDVYQRDVVDLEPILVYMSSMGMPVDMAVREDRAIKLAEKQQSVLQEMTELIPLEARKIEHVFQKTPSSTDGLHSRPGIRIMPTCSNCGLTGPRKDHFKRYVKKSNPCAGAGLQHRAIEVVEWYRLGEFTPSRDALTRYHQHLKRPLPMTYDKKERRKRVSFAEKQIKEMIIKYPDDNLYRLVLDYREIDKLAGTYVGRPIEVS